VVQSLFATLTCVLIAKGDLLKARVMNHAHKPEDADFVSRQVRKSREQLLFESYLNDFQRLYHIKKSVSQRIDVQGDFGKMLLYLIA
jgi:hypothetical protein